MFDYQQRPSSEYSKEYEGIKWDTHTTKDIEVEYASKAREACQEKDNEEV